MRRRYMRRIGNGRVPRRRAMRRTSELSHGRRCLLRLFDVRRRDLRRRRRMHDRRRVRRWLLHWTPALVRAGCRVLRRYGLRRRSVLDGAESRRHTLSWRHMFARHVHRGARGRLKGEPGRGPRGVLVRGSASSVQVAADPVGPCRRASSSSGWREARARARLRAPSFGRRRGGRSAGAPHLAVSLRQVERLVMGRMVRGPGWDGW